MHTYLIVQTSVQESTHKSAFIA